MDAVEIVPLSYPSNLIKKDWNKRKCYTRFHSKEFCDMLHNMEVYEDDVWVVTPPKSGTTWMQELVWLVMNDYNFEAAKSEALELRFPFLEFDYLLNKDLSTALKPVEELKSPRFIKCHLPLPLLPKQLWEKKPKVIYVYRNPKDAWVSAYYHGLSLGFNVTQNIDEYIAGRLGVSEKQPPFDDVMEFYQLRNEPWLYYTSYERMKLNLSEVISDVCKFLNKSITDEQMQQMLHHLSFEEMKKNPTTNHLWEMEKYLSKNPAKDRQPHNFIRKGKVNGYKDDLSPETIQNADKLFESELAKYNITMDELLLLSK